MLSPGIKSRLAGSQNVLLAGAGGGYDVFGALPIATELRKLGKQVHFASLSFSDLSKTESAWGLPNLHSVAASDAVTDRYCPEAWMANWMDRERSSKHVIWCFSKTGVAPLRRAYETLVEQLQIDAVILVDGGIDLILRGDESSIGTPAEDLCSLAAVAALAVPARFIACVGFGAEIRDGIAHEQALARIASLTASKAFLGSTSLAGDDSAVASYCALLDFAFANQSAVRKSHIHRVIRQSLAGELGAIANDVWLSPLLNLYWYFDLEAVAGSHCFLEHLNETEEINQITILIEACRKDLRIQPRTRIPI